MLVRNLFFSLWGGGEGGVGRERGVLDFDVPNVFSPCSQFVHTSFARFKFVPKDILYSTTLNLMKFVQS
jgi:hypothetical protein